MYSAFFSPGRRPEYACAPAFIRPGVSPDAEDEAGALERVAICGKENICTQAELPGDTDAYGLRTYNNVESGSRRFFCKLPFTTVETHFSPMFPPRSRGGAACHKAPAPGGIFTFSGAKKLRRESENGKEWQHGG